MVVLLTVLHVVFCLFLILVILLQTGKGAGMGVAFGGASSTVFGPRGAGSFIGKATAIVAALFMVTSLLLAYVSSSKSTGIAKKAGALAEKRSSEVEEVDLSATEPELPDDGKSEEPEPEPAPAAVDGGAASAGDAGAAPATPDAGPPADDAQPEQPAEALEADREPEPEATSGGDAGPAAP